VAANPRTRVDDSLKGDSIQGRMLEHEAAKHGEADGNQVGDGVVGFLEPVDLGEDERECILGERIDEQALFRPEQAVPSADRPTDCVRTGRTAQDI